MAFELGGNAVIKVADSADALTDLSAYLVGGSLTSEVDELEKTHFGDTDRKYMPGLGSASFSLEGDFDPTVDALLWGIRKQADQAFEYYPQGSDSGDVKYSGVCILTSYEQGNEVGELGKFTAEFRVSGAVTRATV